MSSRNDVTVTHEKTELVRRLRGKIKATLNFDQLISSPTIYKNEDVVTFFKGKQFIPLPNYYTPRIAEIFDLYGGIYNITIDDVNFTVSLYFYKIKYIELFTKKIIEEFILIFQQAHLIEHNVTEMDYHLYMIDVMKTKIEARSVPTFLDLSYPENPILKNGMPILKTGSSLHRYQRHNIKKMLDLHKNGYKIRLNNNLISYFGDDMLYDFVKGKFITEEEIDQHDIHGGIIMDESGVGKTIQMIMYLIEVICNFECIKCDEIALVLVPTDDSDRIRKQWYSEFTTHTNLSLDELPIRILTFDEFRKYSLYNKSDVVFLQNIKILIVDEIHVLWREYSDLLTKLIRLNVPYRWGVSGTPFTSENALINIIQFLTGTTFTNCRIANNIRIQNEFEKVFFRNTKANTADEYPWPTLTFSDIALEFDEAQQNVYDAEKRTIINGNILNLQLLSCQIELLFSKDGSQTFTPKELKQLATNRYESMYRTELSKLKDLITQIENIQRDKDKFDSGEYITRFTTYQKLIQQQEKQVDSIKRANTFFQESTQRLTKIVEGKEVDTDDTCVICMCPHEVPLTYLKSCCHYFCKSCFDGVIGITIWDVSCPICRTIAKKDDIIIAQNKTDITASPKIMKIIDIIKHSDIDQRFIIFTQFSQLIENLTIILNRVGINTVKYSTYDNTTDVKVVILSSEQNAAGVNLTQFNNVIIFEPFQDTTFNDQIFWQLIGRVHRHGQTKPVIVYRLMMLKTIEEKIYAAIQH